MDNLLLIYSSAQLIYQSIGKLTTRSAVILDPWHRMQHLPEMTSLNLPIVSNLFSGDRSIREDRDDDVQRPFHFLRRNA